jgi:hypothetical protein
MPMIKNYQYVYKDYFGIKFIVGYYEIKWSYKTKLKNNDRSNKTNRRNRAHD